MGLDECRRIANEGGGRRVDGTLYRGNMRKKSVADALLRGEKEEREEYRLGGGSYPTRGGVGGTYKTKLRFLPLSSRS